MIRNIFSVLDQRLRNRPDTEHLQVLSRLLIVGIFLSYFYYVQSRADIASSEIDRIIIGLWLTVGFIVLVFVGILIRPGVSPTRRIVSMAVDVTITGYSMAVGGGIAIPAYIVYQFDVLGFGYRYGRKYMYLSMGFALVSFSTVLCTSPYWIKNRAMGLILLLAIIGITIFQSVLIKVRENMEERLRLANEELNQINQLLKNEKDRAQLTLYSIGDAVLTTNGNGEVDHLNRAGELLTGWKEEEAKGRRAEEVLSLLPTEKKEGGLHPVRHALETRKVVDDMDSSFLIARDGSRKPVECSSAPILNDAGELSGAILVFRDISEREKREELTRSRNQLSKFAAHLQAAREEERTRIAREVHDELGNMLTVLRMELANLPLEDRDSLAERVHQISTHVGHTSSSLKKIVTQLRPSLLDTVGLVAAVGWLVRDFSERSGITCEADIPSEELPVDRERATSLFRILQEALTNVARHSKADGVFIRLSEINGDIALLVQDNGMGFSPERLNPRESFGLVGIRERVENWGGEIEVRSSPGEGTTLSVKLPLVSEVRA